MAAVIEGIRAKYSKTGNARYISHLDLIRVFERALRRAEIPVSYSVGFNPHAHMVFGLPISVGASSEAEYADFEFERDKCPKPAEFIKRLNAAMPEGIKITEAAALATKANIMAHAVRARYAVATAPNAAADDAFAKFFAQDTVEVERTTKNGTRRLDIKPMVKSLEWKDGAIVMELDAGSVSNLKPETAITGIEAVYGIKIPVDSVHRTAVFLTKNGKVLEPMDPEALLDEQGGGGEPR